MPPPNVAAELIQETRRNGFAMAGEHVFDVFVVPGREFTRGLT